MMTWRMEQEGELKQQQPAEVRAWIRQDLSRRFGTVLREDLPPDMLALLAPEPQRG